MVIANRMKTRELKIIMFLYKIGLLIAYRELRKSEPIPFANEANATIGRSWEAPRYSGLEKRRIIGLEKKTRITINGTTMKSEYFKTKFTSWLCCFPPFLLADSWEVTGKRPPERMFGIE